MSDDEAVVEEKSFAIEVAKQGRAVCKKCKEKCLQGELRLAKLVFNPFGDGKMKSWHHIDCLFELFLKQRQTTKRIEDPEDIDGWNSISNDDKQYILEKIRECDQAFHAKYGDKESKSSKKQINKTSSPKSKQKEIKTDKIDPPITEKSISEGSSSSGKESKDNSFKEFRRLVADITNVSSYLDKTECVRKVFTHGSDGTGFKGDIVLWCRLLLPGVVKRVYNLQSKQIVKLFSRIFVTDQNDMLEHLENGDIGETIQSFFDQSHKMKPARNSTLTVKEVDKFLERLSCLTKEDDQIEHFTLFVTKCTTNDLKTVIRLIKGDLRMGAGAKHILEGVHPDAYDAYKASRDLESVIVKCLDKGTSGNKTNNAVKADITLMTPVQPMLAEACKSIEQAMKKCPHGMYSEIKYDGERVQVHKKGSEFKYFSRHLKPVMPHKVKHFKEYIPKAFPEGNDLIIDSEVLMIDCNTGTPLPFGTLGIHKKAEFKNASVCLFVFDCIYYNGKSLINKPLSYRKKILQDHMTEIPNHVVFSEMQEIHKASDLAKMIAKVLQTGLEGLVLKDMKSIYAPGKRHWLKVKKDYLFEGAMADSADLIVLGAWYGTGKKGGMMSVFLMGCYDPNRKKFCTVTKVHTGHDDKTLENLQTTLNMVKISQDASKVPNWLVCSKAMIPDFVAKDVKKQPVWEITGAEFTQHDVHTANGISIRFPRVTRIRDDKNWEHATNLQELEKLYQTSKENTDISLLMKHVEDVNGIEYDKSTTQKRKGDSDAESTTNTSPFDVMDNSRAKKKKVEGDSSSSFMEDKSAKKKKKVKQRSESVTGSLLKMMDKEPSPKDTKCDKITAVDDTPKNISNKMDVEEKSVTNNVSSSINYKPEYFGGIKALVEDELRKDEHSELLNSLVEHGGTILPKHEWEDATHVIHYHTVIRDPVIRCSYKVRHLAAEWIKDSIANGGLLDYRTYTVQWDPDA